MSSISAAALTAPKTAPALHAHRVKSGKSGKPATVSVAAAPAASASSNKVSVVA